MEDDSKVANEKGAGRTPSPWLVRPMLFVARLGVVLIALSLWCTVVLAVWVFLVIRAMVAFAVSIVINVSRNADTEEDSSKLERVVLIWPQGFMDILSILFGHHARRAVVPQHPLVVIQETLLAMLFYSWLILWGELAKDIAPVVTKMVYAITPHIGNALRVFIDFARGQYLPF